MTVKSIVINLKDNVGVLLANGKKGDEITINDQQIELLEDIEFGHKVALINFEEGNSVYKYGEEIGYALRDIKKGEWVHIHNMGCRRGKY